MPSIAELAVSIALDEARSGVFENANDNRGPRVDIYAQGANGVLGEAWCVKFVYWCFSRAAAKMMVTNPIVYVLKNERLASCSFIRLA